MNLNEIVTNISAGGVLSIIVIILSLIEVTPIKLSPLKWLGKRVNEDMEKDIKDLTSRVDILDGKLNNHMVESYRTSILDFADKTMAGQIYTQDKWRQMLKVCAAYEHMIETEGLVNGDATEAIRYIRKEYQRCCANARFAGFPQN